MITRYGTVRTSVEVGGVHRHGWSVRATFKTTEAPVRVFEAVHSGVFPSETAAREFCARIKRRAAAGERRPDWSKHWTWVPKPGAPAALAFMRVAPTAERHLTAHEDLYATKRG